MFGWCLIFPNTSHAGRNDRNSLFVIKQYSSLQQGSWRRAEKQQCVPTPGKRLQAGTSRAEVLQRESLILSFFSTLPEGNEVYLDPIRKDGHHQTFLRTVLTSQMTPAFPSWPSVPGESTHPYTPTEVQQQLWL